MLERQGAIDLLTTKCERRFDKAHAIIFTFLNGKQIATENSKAEKQRKTFSLVVDSLPPKNRHLLEPVKFYPRGVKGRRANHNITQDDAPTLYWQDYDTWRIYPETRQEFEGFLDWYLGSTGSGSTPFEGGMASESEPFSSIGAKSIRQPMSVEEFQAQLDRRSEIGEAGELIALKYERQRLGSKEVGCPDPECYVKHIALTDVGRGYDIETTWPGHERCIEVKSSTSSGNDIFMSDNEWTVLEALGKKAWLYRVIVNKNGGDGEVVLRLNDPISKIPKDNISTAVWRVRLPKSDE